MSSMLQKLFNSIPSVRAGILVKFYVNPRRKKNSTVILFYSKTKKERKKEKISHFLMRVQLTHEYSMIETLIYLTLIWNE